MGTTVEKADYAFETKDLLKTEINKINNVLTDESTFRSYPQELFNGYLDILNNGTDTLWNNLEKVSASGEEATLENVETAPMKIGLSGNTIQDGTPTPDYPQEVKVVKGENVVSVQGKNLAKTDYPINLGDIELCKINTYKDYLFKRNGKWYVHKEINKVVFDGTENWARYENGYDNNKRTYKALIPEAYSVNSRNVCICSHFLYSTLYAKDKIGSCFISQNNGRFFVYPEQQDSLNDFKTWLSNNNVTLYYVLATPTEEEIIDETLLAQLEAISNAKSVKDKTYITQTNEELPFILDVEAIKEYEVN